MRGRRARRRNSSLSREIRRDRDGRARTSGFALGIAIASIPRCSSATGRCSLRRHNRDSLAAGARISKAAGCRAAPHVAPSERSAASGADERESEREGAIDRPAGPAGARETAEIGPPAGSGRQEWGERRRQLSRWWLHVDVRRS